jgi:N-acyl-D-amino-acid deacylase
MDIIIKNGMIVDGTGSPSYICDIGIKAGRIVEINRHIDHEAKEVIDASGLVVSPGFIDVHSHNDLVPFMDDAIQNLKLQQGVTTELIGQCGLGVVPYVEDEKKLWKNYVRGVVGDPCMEWNFHNLNEYFNQINAKGLKNNYAALVSHGAIKASVMGFDNKIPSNDQLRVMCNILEESMKAGAFGMSLGLQYMPGIFSSQNELIEMCRVVKAFNGIVMVHLRNHDNTILNAMDEIMSVARSSEVKLHISHLRSYNSPDYGCNAKALINHVEQAAHSGIDITFDEHLYLSGSTLMTQLLPPWVTSNGAAALMDSLGSESVLSRIKEELNNKEIHYSGWDNYSAIAGWDGILITSLRNKENLKFIGKTVGEIVSEQKIHPVDFISKLLIKEQGGVGIVTLDIFSEEDTVNLIRHPLQMVGSDSIPAGVPHPRLYGNYPLFIGKFVKAKGILSLEEAIYKSTGLPAKTLGLKDIGEISLNKTADITIFGLNEIVGFENYKDPTQKPEGIKHVILNGKIAMMNKKIIKGSYGKIHRANYSTICY